ncbi:hypothetical protein V500_02744 [Pseudogymnoascus sp. VKM F-4518 (FW-2643)]|nr:hypothetical protein V500_02744 [Pseudogymnoascus sp. VKM F-4518 (FW-2643)]
MFRLNMPRQALCTRPRISEAIFNSGLRRKVHVSATLRPRFSRPPRPSRPSRPSCFCRSGRKSTVESAIIFTKPPSHGKSIIIAKWSQSKDSNDGSTNTTTNSGTEITSLKTTAYVDFKIISEERFSREFTRDRYGSSMDCGGTLQELTDEIRETIKEIRKGQKELRAEMRRSNDELMASIEEFRRTTMEALDESFAEIEKQQQEHFDRLDRLLIVMIAVMALVRIYSELERRGYIIEEGQVQKLE